MATKKVTITIAEHDLIRIRALVATRAVKSVSSFVQRAVSVSLADVDAWSDCLAEWLEETGGPMTDEERAWADWVLDGAQGDPP